jgi:FkbM family methyltransferase
LSEILVDEWYKSYLPKEVPRVIFDVGANIGLTTLYFKIKYPNAKIFCFEPDPDSYRVLLENTRQLQDIQCLQVGLWDSEKTVKFFQSKHFNTRNSILLDEPETKEVDVSVVPFDRALQITGVNSVDFLKFDIEGAEVEMFKTMDHPTVRSFLGELHPGMRSESAIEDLLASLRGGYDMKLTKGGEKIWHVYGKLKQVVT